MVLMVSMCPKTLKFGIWVPDTQRHQDFEGRLTKRDYSFCGTPYPPPIKITPFLGVESENGADAHKNNTFAFLKTEESGDPRYSQKI